MGIKRTSIASTLFDRHKLKERRKEEIISALKISGHLDIKEIVHIIPGLSKICARRYLDELIVAGRIRKIHLNGARKNARIYEYHLDYESRSDLVGRALCNPLHQLVFSLGRALDES